MSKPREFWIKLDKAEDPSNCDSAVSMELLHEVYGPVVHVIEKTAYDDLSIKIQRTVNAARSALLEMSAWMGIPDRKRETQINNYMENVEYCAKHDLQHMDESQRNRDLRIINKGLRDQADKLADALGAIHRCDWDQDDIHRCRNIAAKALKEYRGEDEWCHDHQLKMPCTQCKEDGL